MALAVYKKTGLTGGTAADLDSVDGDDLSGGEIAFVIYDGSAYTFELDESSGADENSPFVIAPDANPGNKRWLLKNVFGQNQVNLLKNTGFGVWSNSDTNKGLGTMNYDAGDENGQAIPTAGDLGTGGTSGATGKIISISIDSGTFAGTDAAGTIVLGACQGRFQDNETVTFGDGETVVVNMPDSAAGVDLVQNGDFTVDTDPPPGWTASGSTLTTDAGGQVGNMMTVASNGNNLGKAYQDLTTVVGKIYKLELYFKKGTADDGKYMIGTTGDEDAIYDSGALSDAAWAAKSHAFEATATTTRITMQTTDATDTETSLFDEIACYEITPCCTGADSLGPDGWTKDATVDLYRVHNDDGTNTKDGEFYALQVVSTSTNDYLLWKDYNASNDKEWVQRWAGRTITIGAWVKTSEASHVRFNIYDGSDNFGSYHTGGGGWEWLELTKTFGGGISSVTFGLSFSVANKIAYISQPMLVFGSSIGENMYVPPQDKVIWLEKGIGSSTLTGTGHSDVAPTDLNVEADFEAKVPKNIESFLFRTYIRDSGSAAITNGCYLALRPNATKGMTYWTCAGLTNDALKWLQGWVDCDSNGDIDYQIEASGAGTFDIGTVTIWAIKLR